MLPETFFHALADETRLRCVVLIYQQGELCVCELTHALELAQPKISRHLATLRAANIVQDRRQGVWVYYRLQPHLPAWTLKVLEEIVRGIQLEEPFCTDKKRLSNMPKRSEAKVCT